MPSKFTHLISNSCCRCVFARSLSLSPSLGAGVPFCILLHHLYHFLTCPFLWACFWMHVQYHMIKHTKRKGTHTHHNERQNEIFKCAEHKKSSFKEREKKREANGTTNIVLCSILFPFFLPLCVLHSVHVFKMLCGNCVRLNNIGKHYQIDCAQ